MLILLVRLSFIILAVLFGLSSGHYFYDSLFAGMPPWFGGAMGFGVAITLIAAEQGFRRRFSRSLVAFLIGLAGGLTLSWLLLAVLERVIQNRDVVSNIDLPVALITTYLVLVSVLRNVDRLRLVLPFVEFRAERADAASTVLDPVLLGDGRLVGLAQGGLLAGRLLVHRRVLAEWEARAAGEDAVAAARGRRALEILAELRSTPGVQVEVDDTEVAGATTASETALGLARLEGARLAASDRDLVRRARALGLAVLDVHALAASLATVVRPGEELDLLIERVGEGRDQGIAFLDDGGMAVVDGASALVGRRVRAVVLRIHQTGAGKMTFCTLCGGDVAKPA